MHKPLQRQGAKEGQGTGMGNQQVVPLAIGDGEPEDLAHLAKQECWVIDGITVSQADVHQWMATVGHRVPDRQYWSYVKWYDVPRKIARAKGQGMFDQLVAEAALLAGAVLSVKRDMPAPGDANNRRSTTTLIQVVIPERQQSVSKPLAPPVFDIASWDVEIPVFIQKHCGEPQVTRGFQ